MARRSRGAATAVAPVTRATRSRTRLQAAEALAAELNASRNSCDEQSLDITTTSEVSMIDESSNQMNSGESSCSRDSTTVALSPEVNIPNSVVSSDSTVEDSLPATKSDEQNLEEEQQKQLKKEVQDLLDITVDEVVKAQRLPNIDPATTSVQSNVCVRGVCLTKGSLDAKISMYQDYMRKHAPEQPNISIEDNRTPIDSTAEQSLVELQQNSVEQESLSSAINPNFLTITVAPAAKICLESSDVSVVASLETDLSMGQTSMKEEELPISENLQIPVLNSTEITSSNLSSSKETSSDHDNLDASKTDSQRHAQAIHYTSVVEMEGSVDTSLHPETKTSVSSSEASTVNESQNAGKDDGLQMNDNIKFDYPVEQPIGQERISSDVPSQGSSEPRKEPDQICEISSGSSSTSLHPVQVHELVDESDCGSTNAAKQAVTNSSALKVPVAPDLVPGSSLPLTGTVSSPCEIQEELCSEECVKDELSQMNEDSKAEMKTSETVATNQTTSTANIVTINFPNDLNSDNTGTQEMDMEVSDDSREASVEPIIHENQNTVAAADVYSNSSNVEALPPPPPVSNDIPPPPTEDSYADDFYFPPPPTMPPNMDLSQFYMSLHAGDFGAEYTQQLTQYISESVHKWYQIHQYYTFNRAPLPRIDRYKAFMDHYDAFQRVQYTAVMRPNAEAQKLSEERSRNRIQGVLKSLVRDKKKKESAAEKNEELMLLSDEQNEKIAEEPAKPLVEIMPKVLHGSVDVAVVSSSNEVFKKASLPSPQIVNSPKVSRFDNEEVPSIISLEAENVQSVGTSEPRKDFPTDSLDREEPSPPAPFSQNKVKTERSRSRSPKRKRSYSRSRSRSRTRSRSRSRYRSKSRSRSRSRSYGRSRSRSYSRSRTSHSRSRSRSRRRGRSRSRTRSPRRYRSRSPRGYRQKSPRRWHRGYRSFRNSRGGGYRRSSRSPWSDRRSHYKGGYGGFNDRYKRRNYSRSPVREPHSQTEATSTVEKVVENIDEQIKPVEETKKEIVIEEPPFPKFEEIETLIYMDEKVSKNGKKRRLETDLDCDCRKNNLDCSDNRCINREMMFECSSKCGPQCKNRRFALRQYANVKPFYTGPNKGWGVRALEVIPKGTFIIEYIGEVVTNEEFASRQKKYAKDPNHTHHYIFELGQKLIDATVKGNSSRFINHSCDPNAICLKWAVPKTPRDVSRIGFFAKTDIAIGDEITFDYQFCNYGRTAQSCHCGSTNCKGVIGKKPDLGDFDDEEVYDEDSEEFDDGEEPEEEKEREQLRIEKEEQLEAKAIFYLNTIHSEGYYGRKQLAKNAARFVKYLANVLTTENRIRMQSLIERADSEFYQVMKKNNLFNILLQWVSSSGWDRHDLDLKIGVLRMIEEKDKDNFIEKAVGWNQENFPILCELAKGLLPDDIACVDTLEQVVEKVCGDDPEAEGDGNLASYTGVVFNEMTEIATRLASDENIKKGVETTGLKVFKIPKKVREKSVEQKEPVAEKSDHSRDRYDQRSHFRPGFPGYNGKREFERGMKRRYDDRFRRDDEKGVSVRDGNFRTDFKRTRRSRFDQSPVRSPLALAVGAENCGQTDSPATSMSIDSSLSPTKAAMKNVLSAAQSSTHPSSFDSYHQNMAMWQSYMSMGGYPAPYPMMAFSAQKSSMSDSEKKIGYYMSMRLEQLKHFRTSYEMEIKYLDVAIKKKEAEAALAKAHQEAAAAAAAAAALANEANRNEPDSNLPSQSAPPPPPEKRRSTYARALDADGTVYYYHKETRATCWELPEGEHCDENDAVPYTQTQQPDSSMKEDEEPKCQMDIAARAIEIFSSPPGGNEKLEEVPQTTGNVEILSDLPEDEKQKRIRVFKLTVEREVKPIIDSFLKGIPSADANRRLWLIKQVAKEMYKRESSKPDSDLKFNDIIRKKVHNYTKAFMHRKCSDGAKDLWKGFEVFS